MTTLEEQVIKSAMVWAQEGLRPNGCTAWGPKFTSLMEASRKLLKVYCTCHVPDIVNGKCKVHGNHHRRCTGTCGGWPCSWGEENKRYQTMKKLRCRKQGVACPICVTAAWERSVKRHRAITRA